MSDIFFVIGCPRSGTTSYARVLGTATNAKMFTEQAPKLQAESRDLLQGKLAGPADVLFKAKDAAIKETLATGMKYGDKSPCYMPFIPHLAELWDCRILYLIRDGRDVVRSLMDWHTLRKPHVFALPEDQDAPEPGADPNDLWDYSRLRPNPGDPLHGKWKSLSRFQKCAWYWANFNAVALDLLGQIPKDRWMLVDVSRTGADTTRKVFDFLGLEGFDAGRIDEMLNARINSLQEKIGKADNFPRWQNWTAEQTAAFEEFAGDMMRKLGYW
jgi:hypothetical protein